MMFTAGERRLIALYHSGSRLRTAGLIREALLYIDEPDIKRDAESVIDKLGRMNEAEYICLAAEMEETCAG